MNHRTKQQSLALSGAVLISFLTGGTSAQAATACTSWKDQVIVTPGTGSTLGNRAITTIKEASLDGPVLGPWTCILRGTTGVATGPTSMTLLNTIKFEMRLPPTSKWNQRFVFQGGAGADGVVANATGPVGGAAVTVTGVKQTLDALSRGYAVVTMDSGHTALNGSWSLLYSVYTSFGLEREKRTDYGYRAIGTMTDAAKSILARHYDSALTKSFFVGCSNGGRQAVMAAKRFPDKFDGVLAGAPAINIAKQLLQSAWDVQQLSQVATTPWDALTRDDMTLVGSRVRAACDGLDLANDGMVSDHKACQAKLTQIGFPNSLVCPPNVTSNCLSLPKVTALTAMMGGPKNGTQALYASWPWDPGMSTVGGGTTSWRTWRLASDVGLGYPLYTVLGAGFLSQLATSQPDPNYDGQDSWGTLQRYDLTNTQTLLEKPFSPFADSPVNELDVPDQTNLQPFFAKKGRMIVYIGSGDPAISANEITSWYEGLKQGTPAAAAGSRLYVVPGMNHCSGGPATDVFDLFKPLEDWVASSGQTQAPGRVVAAVDPDNNLLAGLLWNTARKRPLCEYPKVARYRGPTILTDYIGESNYSCEY
jgi:hypothetical protein